MKRRYLTLYCGILLIACGAFGQSSSPAGGVRGQALLQEPQYCFSAPAVRNTDASSPCIIAEISDNLGQDQIAEALYPVSRIEEGGIAAFGIQICSDDVFSRSRERAVVDPFQVLDRIRFMYPREPPPIFMRAAKCGNGEPKYSVRTVVFTNAASLEAWPARLDTKQLRPHTCDKADVKGGKYKVVADLKGDPRSIDIVIDAGKLTTENLTALAKRLRYDYCHAKVLMVTIFESEQDAAGWFHELVVSHHKIDRRRGTYVLDREKGTDRLEYNEKKGNPLDECVLDLAKPSLSTKCGVKSAK